MDLIEKFNEEVVKKENKELTKKLKFDTAEWIYKLNEDVDLYKLLVNFTTYKEKELEEFLSLTFFERYGGGIGITRLARAYEMLLEEKKIKEMYII